MIKINIKNTCKTSINFHNEIEGETIEMKMARILNNKEGITDGAPMIYMERKDGINPAYDVRTDRFDLALDQMDVAHKLKIAKREEKTKKLDETKPIQGTEPPKPAA